jgi:hypothetical protein
MAYAHAVIEVPVDADDPGKGVVRYERGADVPDDLPGIEELVEAGSVRDEEYDPSEEPKQTPDFIEIDGVRYIKTGDGATTGEASNA